MRDHRREERWIMCLRDLINRTDTEERTNMGGKHEHKVRGKM